MLASLAHRKSSPPVTGSDGVVNENVTGPLTAGQSFWLNAHHDPVASLKTFSTCLHTCDLYGDGDWRLAVAGLDKKLKVDMLNFDEKLGLACCWPINFGARLPYRFGRAHSWPQSMPCWTFLAPSQASMLTHSTPASRPLLWQLAPMSSSTATCGPTISSHSLWMW